MAETLQVLSDSGDVPLLPRPPDEVKPANLQKDVKRRSKVVAASAPYSTKIFDVTSKPASSPKQAPKNGSNGVADWDATTGQQGNDSYHPSTPVFLKQLLKNTDPSAVLGNEQIRKRRKRTVSKNNGLKVKSPYVAGPAASYGKSPEEMYDEIIDLKKALHLMTSERDVLKGKVLRMERDIVKKDKHIEDLLSSGHVSKRDVTRSLAEKKSLLSTTISALKQQLHNYELQLKEKERLIRSLQQDLRSSRLEELEIQAETYYAEILRLRKLTHSSAPLQTFLKDDQERDVKLTALNNAVQRLSDELVEATQVNGDLEKELDELRKRAMPLPSATHRERGSRGEIADKYVNFKRGQMISAAVDLELQLKKQQEQFASQHNKLDKRIKDLSMKNNELSQNFESLQTVISEGEQQREKLKKVIRKLNEDRTHYRNTSEKLKKDLEAEQEVSASLNANLQLAQNSLDSEEKARDHARKIEPSVVHLLSPSKAKQNEAATIIQRNWKRNKSFKRQKDFQDDLDNAVCLLQSCLKAHVTRKDILRSALLGDSESELTEKDESDLAEKVDNVDLLSEENEEEPILAVQAAFRGHLARQSPLKT